MSEGTRPTTMLPLHGPSGRSTGTSRKVSSAKQSLTWAFLSAGFLRYTAEAMVRLLAAVLVWMGFIPTVLAAVKSAEATVVSGAGGSVATNNPLVTAAANAILKGGSSAIEAAISAALVSAVVEPFGGALSGDAVFTMSIPYDPLLPFKEAGKRKLVVLDGTARPPKRLSPMALDVKKVLVADRRERGMPFDRTHNIIPSRGKYSILTLPGAPAAYCELYSYLGGQLPWAALFAPAIELATNGFALSQESAATWAHGVREVLAATNIDKKSKDIFRERFARNGEAPEAGDFVVQPELARTLTDLALKGCNHFYGENGPVQRMVRNTSAQVGALLRIPAGKKLKPADWRAHWTPPIVSSLAVAGSRSVKNCTVAGPTSSLHVTGTMDLLNAAGRRRHGRDEVEFESHSKTLLTTPLSEQLGGRNPLWTEEDPGIDWFTDPNTKQAPAYHAGFVENADGQKPIVQGISIADRTGQVVALTVSQGRPFGSGICSGELGICMPGAGEFYTLADSSASRQPYGNVRKGNTVAAPMILECGAWSLAVTSTPESALPAAYANLMWTLAGSQRHARHALKRAMVLPERLRAAPRRTAAFKESATKGGLPAPRLFAVLQVSSATGPAVRPFNHSYACAATMASPDSAKAGGPFGSDPGALTMDEHSVYTVTDRMTSRAAVVESFANGNAHFVPKLTKALWIQKNDMGFGFLCRSTVKLDEKIHSSSNEHVRFLCADNYLNFKHRSTLKTPDMIIFYLSTHRADVISPIKSPPVFPLGNHSMTIDPTAFTNDFAENKLTWCRWAEDVGLAEYVVKTTTALELSQKFNESSLTMKEFLPKAGFKVPLILKRNGGTWGKGTRVIKSERHLHKALAKPRELDGETMVQNAALGDAEFTLNYVAYMGHILDIYLVVFGFPAKLFVKSGRSDGRTSKKVFFHGNVPREDAVFIQKLALRTRLNGLGCVQYKKDTGRIKIIEINPRPCGTLIHDRAGQVIALFTRLWHIAHLGYIHNYNRLLLHWHNSSA